MTIGAVYVASPLGFTAAGDRYRREVLTPALIAAGLKVLDPWEDADGSVAAILSLARDDASRPEKLRALNARLGARNRALLASADAVLAVLDGSDVDSGTAGEVGFAAALGCPVIGLRTDMRTGGDNEEAPVNLQVLDFVAVSGGVLERNLDDALRALVGCIRRDEDRFIYHLIERSEYLAAVSLGEFRRSTRGASLEEVGFIHASFRRQVAATAVRHYADVPPSELVLVEIERARLRVPLRIEEAPERSDSFPHLYGPLNLDAVVAVHFGRDAIARVLGEFSLTP